MAATINEDGTATIRVVMAVYEDTVTLWKETGAGYTLVGEEGGALLNGTKFHATDVKPSEENSVLHIPFDMINANGEQIYGTTLAQQDYIRFEDVPLDELNNFYIRFVNEGFKDSSDSKEFSYETWMKLVVLVTDNDIANDNLLVGNTSTLPYEIGHVMPEWKQGHPDDVASSVKVFRYTGSGSVPRYAIIESEASDITYLVDDEGNVDMSATKKITNANIYLEADNVGASVSITQQQANAARELANTYRARHQEMERLYNIWQGTTDPDDRDQAYDAYMAVYQELFGTDGNGGLKAQVDAAYAKLHPAYYEVRNFQVADTAQFYRVDYSIQSLSGELCDTVPGGLRHHYGLYSGYHWRSDLQRYQCKWRGQ